MKDRLVFIIACVTASISAEALGQFAIAKPEAFARAEDQQRARLLEKQCSQDDEEHGCFRDNGRLVRESPCTYRIQPSVFSDIATDQCYKMEPPRRYRGVWIDEFEGQQFIPEGTRAPEWPEGDPKSPRWRKQADQAIAARIWIDVERTDLRKMRQQNGRRMFIEFIGRKTKYPGNHGHMGTSRHEIIVDRVISEKECPQTGVCR